MGGQGFNGLGVADRTEGFGGRCSHVLVGIAEKGD